jgi:hypothetical protein
VLARTVVVQRLAGRVTVRPRRGRPFALRGRRAVPVGSTVDVTRGRIRLTTARSGGGTQSGVFYGSAFVVGQAATDQTDLVLTGGLEGCAATAGRAGSARGRSRRRRLWGKARGHFRTVGRYSSAAVRGTLWYQQDICDSSETDTERGRVHVIAQGDVPAALDVPAGHTVELFCTTKGPPVAPAYCLVAQRDLSQTAQGLHVLSGFFFVRNAELTSYELCISAPGLAEQCVTRSVETFFNPRFKGATFSCPIAGRGPFRVRWRVAGTDLFPPLTPPPFPPGGRLQACS